MAMGSRNGAKHDLREIARHFDIFGTFLGAVPFGTGHINDTYAASYDQGGTVVRYLHQRINHLIFRDPEAQMENVARVTRHIAQGLAHEDPRRAARETLTVVPARDGRPLHVDADGNYWRTYVLIEGTRSYDMATTPDQAYQAARTYGRFQRLLRDLPPPRLHETIPHFHDTPRRVAALEEAIARDAAGRAAGCAAEIASARAGAGRAGRLLALQAEGAIPERVVHNDTKFNNVLLDAETGEGVCVVDLDTVMPGLALYDFGDMVRTTTSPSAEDERDLRAVRFREDLFAALVRGYLESTGDFLTPGELAQLAFSGWLITYEIGVRFLTDHLSGDVYFKVHREGHNLDRCRTQFRLAELIDARLPELDALVARLAAIR